MTLFNMYSSGSFPFHICTKNGHLKHKNDSAKKPRFSAYSAIQRFNWVKSEFYACQFPPPPQILGGIWKELFFIVLRMFHFFQEKIAKNSFKTDRPSIDGFELSLMVRIHEKHILQKQRAAGSIRQIQSGFCHRKNLAQFFANQRTVTKAEQAADTVAGDQNLKRLFCIFH